MSGSKRSPGHGGLPPDTSVADAKAAELVGTNVARLRKSQNLSQTGLAELMQAAGRDHWRQNTVSRVETGKQIPTLADLLVLRNLLGNITEGLGPEVLDLAAIADLHGGIFGLRDAKQAASQRALADRLLALERTLNEALAEVRAIQAQLGGD